MNWTNRFRAVRAKKAPLSALLLCATNFVIVLSPGQWPLSFAAWLGCLLRAWAMRTQEKLTQVALPPHPLRLTTLKQKVCQSPWESGWQDLCLL